MKKNHLILYIAISLSYLCACDSDTTKPTPTPPTENINLISQFVYDGMAKYYKWADEIKDKKPTHKDTDPVKYFYSLRNKDDVAHNWSWITNNLTAVLKSFSGKSVDFGYDIAFKQMANNRIYAVVKYVYPNSPADLAGIKRLDLIGDINGKPLETEIRNGKFFISRYDKDKLLGTNPARFTIYKIKNKKIEKERDVTLIPRQINTNPILKDSIYNIGNKKIGYLFYTRFISEYNNQLYNIFAKFHDAKINELILDLRYNHGGALSAATYLCSMIAPNKAVANKEVLTQLIFNKTKETEAFKLGDYDEPNEENPITVNLNLKRIYIIATEDSYSASELTTFCLKAHMNVIHIGGHTAGKYTASTTIHAYNDKFGRTVYKKSEHTEEENIQLYNWGMQPIVAIYTDKNRANLKETNGLIPNYPLIEGFGNITQWTPLGDTKDTFLGQALYLITAEEKLKPVEITTRTINNTQEIHFQTNPVDEITKGSVLIK